MTYASRKTLLATISPTPYDKPLLLDLVTPAPHRFFLGVALSGVSLVGSGGAGAPYSYSIISGSLPTGLSLNGSTGAITGTPTVQGAVSFVAEVQDSASNVFDHSLTINIESALGALQGGSQPPPGRRDVSYRFAFLVADFTGSTAGITYSVTTGSAPSGLSLSSAGVLSGTPTAGAVGTTTFTVTATKTGAGSLAIPVTMVVLDRMTSGTLTVPNELRFMTKGVPVSAYLTLTSLTSTTTAALVFSIASGALPSGLTMDAFGLVSGTPDTVTLSTYTQPTIRVTDPNTQSYIDFTLTAPNTFNVATRLKASAVASTTQFAVVETDGSATSIDYLAAFFGDGSDGDVTINGTNTYSFAGLSAGQNVLSRDVYINNLTITGSGVLTNNFQRGYDIYVSGVLDISAAGANSIIAGGLTPPSGWAFGANGGTGGTGATGAGGVGGSGTTVAVSGGGIGGVGGGGGGPGDGGAGSTGAAGASGTSGNTTVVCIPRPFNTNDICQTAVTFSPIGGGAGGGGGGGGGGNGIAAGANGGAGGGGGGRLRIFARSINRGASTAAGAISAKGATGANGSNGAASGRGGGGGGLGGGGGKIRIVFGELTGSTATNAVDASGGAGGNGGNSGGGTATAGKGGSGGYGGSITLNNLIDATTTVVSGSAGSVNSSQTGGAGGACKSNL